MARLTKEQLADRTRYQFKRQEVDLPELGGTVEVKTLSVAERDALPDLVDENGNPSATVDELAATFAAIVSDPQVSVDEAKGFIGALPASAYDRVLEKFSELLKVREEGEAAEVAKEFRGSED